MDGSSYPPRYEKPQEDDVEGADRRHLVLLVILAMAAGGFFFSFHRQDALRLGACLMSGGLSCETFKLPPDGRDPDQPSTDH